MTILDSLDELWNGILQTMAQFVIPDWNAIIGLLPLLIFLGVVAPLLTFLPLGIVIYQLRKPRVKGVRFEEGPTVAAIGENYVPAEYQDREDFDGFLTEAEEVYTEILSS